MGNNQHGKIKSAALRYLGEHTGVMVHSADIAKASGFTQRQIAHSIYQMRRNNPTTLGEEITVYQGGHTYMWRPKALPPAPESAPEPPPKAPASEDPFSRVDHEMLYEQIGVTKKGTVVVRGIDGTLFKLAELIDE